MPQDFVTFSEIIYVGTIWCGRSVLIDFDVTMTTKFWQAGKWPQRTKKKSDQSRYYINNG